MPAPKGNRNAQGNKGGGRKSAYRDEYAVWALKLTRLGAIDKQLAEAFEVSVSAINRWKKEHIEFSEALKKGKAFADANVADALYHRALGYAHPDTHISNYQGEITKTPITKHHPPDTTAAIFWLKNRQPKQWRDRQEHTGADGQPIQTVTRRVIDASGLSDSALDELMHARRGSDDG